MIVHVCAGVEECACGERRVHGCEARRDYARSGEPGRMAVVLRARRRGILVRMSNEHDLPFYLGMEVAGGEGGPSRRTVLYIYNSKNTTALRVPR